MSEKPYPITEAVRRQRSEASFKHGGAAAERAITKGDDFTGLAQQTEQQVSAELETEGAAGIVRRSAIRLQTVSDLYYQAILGATDIEKLDAYAKRWGWLQGSALRAWAQVRELEKQESPQDITDILRGTNGD